MENQNEIQNENQVSKAKKPFYRQWWFYVVIAIVVASIIGVLAGGLVNQEGDNPNILPSTSENPKKTYFIGDSVSVNNLEFTIKQVTDTNVFIIGSEVVKTENNFIKIVFTVKNNANTSILLFSSNLKLYREEARYQTKYESSDLTFYDLAPGLSKEFFVIFEVPDKTTESDYLLEVKNSDTSESIKLKNKE